VGTSCFVAGAGSAFLSSPKGERADPKADVDDSDSITISREIDDNEVEGLER